MSIPRARLPARAAALAVALALVLLLHAVLLGVLPIGLDGAADDRARPLVRIRGVTLAPPALAAAPPPAAAPAAPAGGGEAGAALAARPAASAADRALAVAPLRSTPTPSAAGVQAMTSSAGPPGADPAADADPEASLAVAPIDPAASAPPGGWLVPTFATRLPPAAVLRYELRRGSRSAEAELVWQPRSDGYALVLTAGAGPRPLLGWASSGGFDADGVAPQRFVEQRRARDARSVNFRRDVGRIGFSGPAIEYPLLPGAQDRLSWLVQLGAIVAAAPEHFAAGAAIPLFVVGARGDGDVWTFVVQGHEPVELAAAQRLEGALRLLREPRRAWDTRVEVWLDPARHHLPVRLKLSPAQGGDGNEFVLRELTSAGGS